MLSIDQNCHSLWDVIPKIHALTAQGHGVTHLIEDLDMAFTALGASLEDDRLTLARERYHGSGGQDWGAALFYSELLGTLPLDLRDLEPALGQKISKLARQLDTDVDRLYDRYSPGDNWQLIGPSYIGDREHHRTIGDLGVSEAAQHVRDLLARARTDLRHRLPEPDPRRRIDAWLDRKSVV